MPDVLFENFCSLVHKLGNPPRSTHAHGQQVPATKIFQSWVNHLSSPTPHTGKRLFRLLFPHEGARRRYGLKETTLCDEIGRALGVDLRLWDAVGQYEGLGCLGHAVENAMCKRATRTHKSTLTLTELDGLLDQLAAPSPFSQLSQMPENPRTDVILHLYRDCNLSPLGLSVLTQIILRDLRPLLSPVPRIHPTLMLRRTITTGPQQLGLHAAMWCWSPAMARLYRDGKGCVDWCADAAEAMSQQPPGPLLGVNVQIPKCEKARSIKDAIKFFCKGPAVPTVYAETKYDGYRMQIHVKGTDVKIFSKSKRESTTERANTHSIILMSLGLDCSHAPVHPALASKASTTPRILSSVILEAEVVPWNEASREGGRGPGVEEFWWLQAAGVVADGSRPRGDRHLCLAFFDILHLDGQNLLNKSYDHRRQLLEQVVYEIPGFCFLAHRTPIPLGPGAEERLQAAFDHCINNREEGLVLKAGESTYNDTKLRWVKLKKDYIPNLGDCIDLVVLGAGWDKDRARELRVDTSVYTTFYVGVLTASRPPHFEILFTVSYGMSRDQLEVYNENIRLGRWRSKPFDKDDPWKRRLLGLAYQYTLPKSIAPPSVLFEQPLCAEVMGAGFQKQPHLYELRWPRLMKIFDKSERPWTKALRGPQLVAAAHEALGYGDSHSLDDSLKMLWRTSSTAIDIPDLSPKRRASAPPDVHYDLSPARETRPPKRPRLEENVPLTFPPLRPLSLRSRIRRARIIKAS